MQHARGYLVRQLSRSLEAPLALATSRLDCAAANGPATIGHLPVVHSPSLTREVVLLPFHRRASLPAGSVQGRNLLENSPLLPVT